MTEQPLTKTTVDVLGSRMAYHERGEGAPVLLLHGNPTSSYLWRDVIPELEGRGRLIAPDLIGMGDSAKLPNPGPDTYRFTTHRKYLAAFIDAVIGPSQSILFVVHDWAPRLASTGPTITATGSAASPTWRPSCGPLPPGMNGARPRRRFSRDSAPTRASR
jgi:pimeloyl-ACP methyl ester carboxylesterase